MTKVTKLEKRGGFRLGFRFNDGSEGTHHPHPQHMTGICAAAVPRS